MLWLRPLLFLFIFAGPSFALAQVDVGETPELPSSGDVVQSAGHVPLQECRRWPVIILLLEPQSRGVEESLRSLRKQFQFWRWQEVHFVWCAKAAARDVKPLLGEVPAGIEVVASSSIADAWNKGFTDISGDGGFLYLLDGKGAVVWVGGASSTEEWASQLRPVVARAQLDRLRWDSGERDPLLKKSADYCRKQQFKKAWKETDKLLRSLEDGDSKRDLVDEFRADFDKEADFRVQHLNSHAVQGCFEVAWSELTPQLKLWAGTPMGDRFRDLERQWKKDRQIKKLRVWDKIRVEALRTIWITGNRGKGLKMLRAVIEEATGSLLDSVLASDLVAAQQV